MKFSQFIFLSLLTASMSSFACPIAQNITDVGENWDISLKSLHEQTILHDSYNYISSIDDKNQLTEIAILTSKKINQGDKLDILFNSHDIYREDHKAIDRSAKGVASLNGELIEVQITMNDKKDKEITLGEFIKSINDDFKVECKLKESVRYGSEKPLSAISNTSGDKSSTQDPRLEQSTIDTVKAIIQ